MILKEYAQYLTKMISLQIILVHITSYQIPGQHFFDIELLVKFVMRQFLEKKNQLCSQGFSACPGENP